MLPTGKHEYFGEPPLPRLDFLRLRSQPPKVKKAAVTKIAKFARGDSVVLETRPDEGPAALRSAEVIKVELGNPNYKPKPRTDLPEAVYLIKFDSTFTTRARTTPRWVREDCVHPRPVGVQGDVWQQSKLKWNRIWKEDDDFCEIADRESRESVQKTLRQVNRKLLKSFSTTNLFSLPVSRLTALDHDMNLPVGVKPESLGLNPKIERSTSSESLLRYGAFPKMPPKLAPLREVSPPLRHRQPGCLRQRRVRNQIAPPPEHPRLVDSRALSPWYTDKGLPRIKSAIEFRYSTLNVDVPTVTVAR